MRGRWDRRNHVTGSATSASRAAASKPTALTSWIARQARMVRATGWLTPEPGRWPTAKECGW